jgi:hypothetical protein
VRALLHGACHYEAFLTLPRRTGWK